MLPERITYVEHAADVMAHAVRLHASDKGFVLVTSIDIKGGAARELGSIAVVDPNGEMFGYMSNGCIDRDIQLRAMQMVGSDHARVMRYGEGSSSFDLKLPCGGALELLLDPSPDMDAIERAYRDLQNRTASTLCFAVPDRPEPICFEYTPKPRLCLAGRGAVFRATAQVAATAGFEVALYSPEAEDLEALADVPSVEAILLTSPSAVPDLKMDSYCGFLTLFHDHDWEPMLLAAAVKTDARFIGSLGSRKTHAIRLETLKAMGIDPAQLERLRGPIGLVPSLRSAPFIGISSIAELVDAFPRTIFVKDI